MTYCLRLGLCHEDVQMGMKLSVHASPGFSSKGHGSHWRADKVVVFFSRE